MKKNLLPMTAALGITAALTITSCTYDPAYTRVSGSYSTGYGYGHGYGGSGFSTSVFVSTGDPRWGYDPYTYSYYDYRTRRYYDPYLYGYYPIGYRPPVLIGVPHPYGWRPGRGYCPPPRVVRNVTVVNYRNRESAYRQTNHNWARSVRKQDYSRSQNTRQSVRPESSQNRGWQNPDTRRDSQQRTRDSDRRTSPQSAPSGRPGSRDARVPSNYHTPVNRNNAAASRDPRQQPRAATSQPNIRSAPREVQSVRPQTTVRRPDARVQGSPTDPRRSSAFRDRGNVPQPQALPRPQTRPQPQPQAQPRPQSRPQPQPQAQPRPQPRPQPQAQPQPAPRQAPSSRESDPQRGGGGEGRGGRENRRGLRSLGEA